MAETKLPAEPENWLQEPQKLPSTLNVITILTFIGSGIAIISQIYTFSVAQSSYDKMLEMRDKLDQMPALVKNMMGSDPVEMSRKALENRVPLLILNVVGAALCVYGAIQMRKWKKAGFPIYLIGELLPFVSMVIFLGITGGISLIFGCIISLVFIIMYASQLKHLS